MKLKLNREFIASTKTCVCCLEGATKAIRVGRSQVSWLTVATIFIGATMRNTLSYEFPVCEICFIHTTSSNRKSLIICLHIFAILFTCGLSAASVLGYIVFGLIPIIISCILFLKSVKPIDYPLCCTRQRYPVELLSFSNKEVTFKFNNAEYLKQIQQLNTKILTPTQPTPFKISPNSIFYKGA